MAPVVFVESRGPKGEVILRLDGERPIELIMARDTADQVRSGGLPISVGYMQGKLKLVGSSGRFMDLLAELDGREFVVDDS